MFTFRSVGAWERGYVYPTLAGFRGKVIDVGNDEGCPEVGSLPKNKSGVSESNSGVTPPLLQVHRHMHALDFKLYYAIFLPSLFPVGLPNPPTGLSSSPQAASTL